MRTNTKILIAKIIYFFYLFLIEKNLFIRRNGINWNLDLSEGIDLSIFFFGSFQSKITDSIVKVISKKRKLKYNIIDIGSNIGDKSLTLSNKLIKKIFKISKFILLNQLILRIINKLKI